MFRYRVRTLLILLAMLTAGIAVGAAAWLRFASAWLILITPAILAHIGYMVFAPANSKSDSTSFMDK